MQLVVAQDLAIRVQALLELRPDLARDLVPRAVPGLLAVESLDVPVRDVDREQPPDRAVAVLREIEGFPELRLRDDVSAQGEST